MYGLTLFRSKTSPRYLKCYEHPSLSFDLQKNRVFYNAKTTHGMNAYDFVAFYENCSFLEAREKVNQYYKERDPRYMEHYLYNPQTKSTLIHYGLLIPLKYEGNQEQLRQYLSNQGVSSTVIDKLIMNNLAY